MLDKQGEGRWRGVWTVHLIANEQCYALTDLDLSVIVLDICGGLLTRVEHPCKTYYQDIKILGSSPGNGLFF